MTGVEDDAGGSLVSCGVRAIFAIRSAFSRAEGMTGVAASPRRVAVPVSPSSSSRRLSEESAARSMASASDGETASRA